MRKFYILLGFLAVVAGVVAIGFILAPMLGSQSDVQSGVVVTDEEEINSRALAFVQPAYRDDYGNARVAGYIDNLGDRTLIATSLEIELRDETGDRALVLEHSVPSVPPGQRKWFDIDAGTWTGPLSPTVVVTSVEVTR